jgi:hypothetical protein
MASRSSNAGVIRRRRQAQVDRALQTPYSYRPLDKTKNEIRIVEVSVSNESSDVFECDIEHKLLSEVRYTYEAISYVWGEPSRNHNVLCDDSVSHLKVTSNLREVLRQLASLPRNTGSQTYWIDSICINQEDAVERGSQVQKMADIYRLSERVHIFLGVLEPGQHPLQSEWFTRRWVSKPYAKFDLNSTSAV